MIWAFTDDNYYVVHYERGGYAHSFHVLVVQLKTNETKPSFIWHGVGFGILKNYPAFLDAVSKDKLDDTENYSD